MKVVHCKREPYDIYIGRPGPYGNPFVMPRDGNREEVIQKFEAYARALPNLLDILEELNGKVLACWCSPLACHGDVWVKLCKEFLTNGES